MGLKWLVFLIRSLDLIDMWSGEEHIANIMKIILFKRYWTRSSNIITTRHSIVNAK